jgi:hypothetical protein
MIKISVITLDGRMLCFKSAATILQLLEVLLNEINMLYKRVNGKEELGKR